MTNHTDERAKQRRMAQRDSLYARAKQGDISLVDAVKLMRRVAGKTQTEYARMVEVSPRVLIDFERGVGNPTLRSLERMVRPFGMQITVRSSVPPSNDQPYRYHLLDDTGAVFAQARDMREALEIAKKYSQKHGGVCFLRDAAKQSKLVASVDANGRIGKDRAPKPKR